jgi:hypothetical protein
MFANHFSLRTKLFITFQAISAVPARSQVVQAHPVSNVEAVYFAPELFDNTGDFVT